jgi:hypothetical protein
VQSRCCVASTDVDGKHRKAMRSRGRKGRFHMIRHTYGSASAGPRHDGADRDTAAGPAWVLLAGVMITLMGILHAMAGLVALINAT